MSKKNTNTIINVFEEFKKNILDKKPSQDKMFEEVQMMKFKIRPLQGDISLINFNNNHLIEVLWSLGKLDDFFKKEYRKLSIGQRELFFRFFNSLYQKFQDQLNTLNLKTEKSVRSSSVVFEMEIFKERLPKKKLN